MSYVYYFFVSGAVGSAPARTPRDPGSNPDPGDNFSLKLATQDIPDG